MIIPLDTRHKVKRFAYRNAYTLSLGWVLAVVLFAVAFGKILWG
jgi:hypothetical protein